MLYDETHTHTAKSNGVTKHKTQLKTKLKIALRVSYSEMGVSLALW